MGGGATESVNAAMGTSYQQSSNPIPMKTSNPPNLRRLRCAPRFFAPLVHATLPSRRRFVTAWLCIHGSRLRHVDYEHQRRWHPGCIVKVMSPITRALIRHSCLTLTSFAKDIVIFTCIDEDVPVVFSRSPDRYARRLLKVRASSPGTVEAFVHRVVGPWLAA